jgi:hypothetical protein
MGPPIAGRADENSLCWTNTITVHRCCRWVSAGLYDYLGMQTYTFAIQPENDIAVIAFSGW